MPDLTLTNRAALDDLHRKVADCGFFPGLIMGSITLSLGDEPVRASLVHHEATFSHGVHRHLTWLIATPTRLLVGHTDEAPSEPHGNGPLSDPDRIPDQAAISSCEAIGLHRIQSVNLSRVVNHAAQFDGDQSEVVETWLTINWGVMRRIELEPSACSDPQCEADHGQSGVVVGDDINLRMSQAADGAASVADLVAFTTTLQSMVGR